MPLKRKLLQAYLRTHYCVLTPRGELLLRPGTREPLHWRCGRWVILSADNPRSIRLSESWNNIRFKQLQSTLRAGKHRVFHSLNRDPNGRWPDERGLMICGISLLQAMRLGRRFGQYALLAGEPGRKIKIVWL